MPARPKKYMDIGCKYHDKKSFVRIKCYMNFTLFPGFKRNIQDSTLLFTIC